MSAFEFVVIIVAGIVMFFALGFLFGVGYQQTEDRLTMKKIKKEYEKRIAEAKEETKRRQDAEWEELMENPLKDFPWNEEIKFGRF